MTELFEWQVEHLSDLQVAFVWSDNGLTALANIFVEYYEEKLFFKIRKPAVYFK